MAGRFYVRMDSRPNLADIGSEGPRSASFDYHIKCSKCFGVVDTITALTAKERELRHQEATQIANSTEYCEICGAGVPVPSVAETALDVAQM